jgi:hypothetical protein
VEGKALDSNSNIGIETSPCEALKKRSYVLRSKPRGLAPW